MRAALPAEDLPMRAQPKPSLVLLACLLTGVASADDFSLLRRALPSFFVSAGVLPLDDPNTDFLVVTGSWAAPRGAKDDRSGVVLPGRYSGAGHANRVTAPAPSVFQAREHQHPRLIELRTPLRC